MSVQCVLSVPLVCQTKPFVSSGGPNSRPSIGFFRPFIVSGLRSRGFTLIELMVTLVVGGILAVMAVPAITTFVESNRLTTTTNDLIVAINAGRSEAIKRGVPVIMCKSSSGTGCSASGTWQAGWVLFVDVDGSGGWTTNDIMLRSHESVPPTFTITAAADSVVFKSLGTISAGAGNYTICNTKIKKQRSISLKALGQTSILEGSC